VFNPAAVAARLISIAPSGLLFAILASAAIIDRIAVVVDSHAIKTSDIQRELRVASFLNRRPLDESSATMRQAAERLIDQELVRQEILHGQYAQPTEKDVEAFLQQLKHDRFSGSDAQFRAELTRHHLTEDQLRRQLLWQLTVLRFIDQRFRPAILVTDDDIAAWRQQHAAETRNLTADQIRELITGERINQAFDDWLKAARRDVRIEYRPQAFIGSTQ
jgi:hypothetical protein